MSDFFGVVDIGETPQAVFRFAVDDTDIDSRCGGGIYLVEGLVVLPHDGQSLAQGGGVAEEVFPQVLRPEGGCLFRFSGNVVGVFLLVVDVGVASDEHRGAVTGLALEGDVDTRAVGIYGADGKIGQVSLVIHLRFDDAAVLLVVEIELQFYGVDFVGVVYGKVTVEYNLGNVFELSGESFDSGGGGEAFQRFFKSLWHVVEVSKGLCSVNLRKKS